MIDIGCHASSQRRRIDLLCCAYDLIGWSNISRVVTLDQQLIQRKRPEQCGITAGANAYPNAQAAKLPPLLDATTKPVNNPGLGGLHLLAHSHHPIDAFHTMNDQGLAHKLAQAHMLTKDLQLQVNRS